jgi:hypothetical protein
MCNNNNRYVVDEITDVSQGDSVGHKIIRDIGSKYIYMYGEDLTRDPNINYEQLIDDYILASERTLLKNGKQSTIYFDPFSRYVFNNDALRGWYGSSKAAYKIMNPQYIRHTLGVGIRQSLRRDAPNLARDKVPDDNMADIIPAGSVRQSIMLYLEHLFRAGWTMPDGLPGLPLPSVLEHISYIALLCGIANAFGNTTHDADYNTGIGDNYRYIANRIC